MITTLIVDDELDMRSLVRIVLEVTGEGIEVIAEAADGAEALDRFHELDPPGQPSVVILDNRMPNIDGLTAAEKIKSEFPDQPVVLFSAFLDDATRERADQLGVRCVDKSKVDTLPDVVLEVARSTDD